MKVVLISMPDATAQFMHEEAAHMPNLGIASIGGNIDPHHQVVLIDLIRKRRSVKKYLTETLNRIEPDLIGLSTMTWQYQTCVKIIELIKKTIPSVRIAVGGYHPSLMYKEIARSPEARHIDFIVRGEGENVFRKLVNAIESGDGFENIPSLSYRIEHTFYHNEPGELLDLSTLKLPIRDERRLTSGYHLLNSKIEVVETSRGCTRGCNFCSIGRMYGRKFRAFPTERVIADLEDIYYKRNTRWVFVSDDNLVLYPKRVIELCDAILDRKLNDLRFVVQADCISMARNEEMVKKMGQAGVRNVFLGIESVSKRNLEAAHKDNVVVEAQRAVDNCHKYGMMVMGGLIFGFPDDDEEDIINNYQFLNDLDADASYCQILTPYPKTEIRDRLIQEGLITNVNDYKYYNGVWANVKTRSMDSNELQYLFWFHKENVLGWWNPSTFARRHFKVVTAIWNNAFKPLMKYVIARQHRKLGWQGRFEKEIDRLRQMNRFDDLD